MPLDSVFGDEKRTRIGLLFLVAGTLLVVWAWGSWVFRTADNPEAPGEVFGSGAPGEATDGGMTKIAVGIAALAGIGLVGYLLVRRYRRRGAGHDEPFGSPDASNDQPFSHDSGGDSG